MSCGVWGRTQHPHILGAVATAGHPRSVWMVSLDKSTKQTRICIVGNVGLGLHELLKMLSEKFCDNIFRSLCSLQYKCGFVVCDKMRFERRFLRFCVCSRRSDSVFARGVSEWVRVLISGALSKKVAMRRSLNEQKRLKQPPIMFKSNVFPSVLNRQAVP